MLVIHYKISVTSFFYHNLHLKCIAKIASGNTNILVVSPFVNYILISFTFIYDVSMVGDMNFHLQKLAGSNTEKKNIEYQSDIVY